MNCDAASLMEAAKCFRCVPAGMLGAVHTYLLCQWANNIGPACDTDAQTFLTYTQITDATTVSAICNLVASLKSNPSPPATSFWSREIMIYPMVAGPAANNLSWRANLKTPGTYDLTEVVGREPTYSAQGIQGDHTNSEYLKTGYSPPVAAGDWNVRAFYYVDVNSTVPATSSYFYGMIGNAPLGIAASRSAANAKQAYIKDFTIYVPVYAGGGDLGAYLWQRSGTNSRQAARNGGNLISDATAQVSGGATGEIYLFARNNVGPGGYSNARMSGFSYGKSFADDSEWLLYRGIWETFEAAMGRGHPLGV